MSFSNARAQITVFWDEATGWRVSGFTLEVDRPGPFDWEPVCIVARSYRPHGDLPAQLEAAAADAAEALDGQVQNLGLRRRMFD